MTARDQQIEIRGFLKLSAYIKKTFGTTPYFMDAEGPISGYDLAVKLGIDPGDVEVIFVNGFVQGLDYIIQPGDRMAFLPPGCPGPYRIALGFYGKNQGNAANFKIQKKDDETSGGQS